MSRTTAAKTEASVAEEIANVKKDALDRILAAEQRAAEEQGSVEHAVH